MLRCVAPFCAESLWLCQERENFLKEMHEQRAQLNSEHSQALTTLRKLHQDEIVVRNRIAELEGRAAAARGAMQGEESKLEAIRNEAIEVEKEIEASREGVEVCLLVAGYRKKGPPSVASFVDPNKNSMSSDAGA